MKNIPTLAQAASDPRVLTSLDYETLIALLAEADEAAKQPAFVKKAISNLLEDRLSPKISEAFLAKGEDTGVVRIDLGRDMQGRELRADVTRVKKVTWDQDHLAKTAQTIRDGGDDPAEFVDITYSVPEAKFKAWPSFIKKLFEAGRTVTPGNPAIKLVVVEEKAA